MVLFNAAVAGGMAKQRSGYSAIRVHKTHKKGMTAFSTYAPLFSGATALLFLSCCNAKEGMKASTIRVRIRNHQQRPQHSSTRSGKPRQDRTGEKQRKEC